MTSGEAVPVASKGIFTFDESAISAVGSTNADGTTGGKAPGAADANWTVDGSDNVYAVDTGDGKIGLSSVGSGNVVGKVLGTGKRTAQSGTDQFAGAKGEEAYYAVIKLDL